MSDQKEDHVHLWRGFANAIGAELRPEANIRGASGLDHVVQGVAVDEANKRLVVISAEPNPRTAALVQVDIQATLPETRVLVARPIVLDVANLIQRVVEPLGLTQIDIPQAKTFMRELGNLPQDRIDSAINPAVKDVMASTMTVYKQVSLPPVDQLISLAMQAQDLPWADIMKLFGETASSGVLDLTAFLAADSMQADLNVGVCPLPLYEFGESDFDLFLDLRRREEATARLRELGIYQYFFPPPDHVALGLVEKGVQTEQDIVQALQQTPSLGHPFGDTELVRSPADLVEMLDELRHRGYVAEGEQEIQISETGKTMRSMVKFRPRESFLTKLLGRLSFNASISPKDFH